MPGSPTRAAATPTDTTPRSDGRWTLHVDGAARGNPGPAAAGIVLVNGEGHPVRRIGRALGRLTNNQAEYRALLLALEAVAAYRLPDLLICMDSQVVVRQVTGSYRVTNPTLQQLHAQVGAALARLGRVEFQHVPRERNAAADELANQALDGEPVDQTL